MLDPAVVLVAHTLSQVLMDELPHLLPHRRIVHP